MYAKVFHLGNGGNAMKKLMGILMVLGVMVGGAYAAETVVVPPTAEVRMNVGGGRVTSVEKVSDNDVKAISALFTGEATAAVVSVALDAGKNALTFKVNAVSLVLKNVSTGNFDRVQLNSVAAGVQAAAAAMSYDIKDNGPYDAEPATGQVKFVYATGAGSSSKGGSGGGCSALALGALSLLFVPMALVARKKN